MPQPTRSDVHVNKPLTMLSIAYIQEAKDFVASRVFSTVPVEKQSDRYFAYKKGDWFRTGAQKRGAGDESAGSGFNLDNTPNYFADVWALHMDVPDQIRGNQDSPLNLDRDATRFVTQGMLLRKEIVWSTKYMKAGVWTGAADFTPNPLWDSTTGLPINDIDLKKQEVKAQTGYLPDTFTASIDVFFAIKNNPSVLDRIKYTQTAVITEDLLASLLQLRQFLVSSAVLNSAAEGQADSMGFLNAKSALLTFSNPSPGIMMPSAGYTFAWKGMYGAGDDGGRISSFRIEPKKSDRIEGEMAFDLKVVGPDLGVFFDSPIS